MTLLYTTKQIAEMYSAEKETVTPYMITHTWVPNGLKHIKGKGQSFLYKKEWVDEYLEEQSIEVTNKKITPIRRNNKGRLKKAKCFVV